MPNILVCRRCDGKGGWPTRWTWLTGKWQRCPDCHGSGRERAQ